MWPLLLLLALSGGGAKAKKGVKIDPDLPPPDDCKDIPYFWEGPALGPLPDLDKLGMTENEKVGLQFVHATIRAGAPGGFCKYDVMTRPMVEGKAFPGKPAGQPGYMLDDFGAAAMIAYWESTSSDTARPFPTFDPQVLAIKKQYYDKEGKLVSLATYLVERLALMKQALLTSAANS